MQTDDAFADPAEAAGMRLRLSTIEENLRQVSGQTAELVQSLDKLMQQVETVRQDNEFRFQQIEGSLGRAAVTPMTCPRSAGSAGANSHGDTGRTAGRAGERR